VEQGTTVGFVSPCYSLAEFSNFASVGICNAQVGDGSVSLQIQRLPPKTEFRTNALFRFAILSPLSHLNSINIYLILQAYRNPNRKNEVLTDQECHGLCAFIIFSYKQNIWPL